MASSFATASPTESWILIIKIIYQPRNLNHVHPGHLRRSLRGQTWRCQTSRQIFACCKTQHSANTTQQLKRISYKSCLSASVLSHHIKIASVECQNDNTWPWNVTASKATPTPELTGGWDSRYSGIWLQLIPIIANLLYTAIKLYENWFLSSGWFRTHINMPKLNHTGNCDCVTWSTLHLYWYTV